MRLEMVAAIEQYDVIERCRANTHGAACRRSENLIDRRLGVVRKGRDPIANRRNRGAELREWLDRHLTARSRIAPRENEPHPRAAEIPDHELVRPVARRLPRRVAPPARRHQIHAPVAVEITGGESNPSARV